MLTPGRLLAAIVRSRPAQPVELLIENTHVGGHAGLGRLRLPVVQVALGRARDILPVLTSVRCEMERNQLTLAATDRPFWNQDDHPGHDPAQGGRRGGIGALTGRATHDELHPSRGRDPSL